MKQLILFFKHIFENRYLISQLTMRNVTKKYKRSYLGMFWSLAEPLGFMLVLYLVFGIGLRSGRNLTVPFVCFLISGLAVMSYFSEAFSGGVDSVKANSYLLKKVNFKMSVLPFVTVMTGLVNHIIFMIPLVFIFILNGIYPSVWWLQTFYYTFCLIILLLGINWFTAAVGVFIPDLKSIVYILNRLLFYCTPVFWVPDDMPENIISILKWNPMFYITMGYRDSLLFSTGLWTKPMDALFFWLTTVIILLIGSLTFRKLRPQFADVV